MEPRKLSSNNCIKIEKVLIKFTKRLFHVCNMGLHDYDQRLHILNLQKLSTRRLYADLLMAYKIINNYVDVSTETILSTYKAVGSRDLCIRKDICRKNVNYNFFGNRVASTWNSLHTSIKSSKSIATFRNSLFSSNIVLL